MSTLVRHNYRRFFILSQLVLLGFFIGISGCKTKQTEHSDKTVFRYNEPGGITSLDPAYARNLENIWVVNQLFDGLVGLDEELNVIPAIARKWEVDSSATQYTFHLNTEVLFHEWSGQQRLVKASDVVYSFERVQKPETASPGRWVFADVYKVTALNDSTVEVLLKQPSPSFLSILTMPYCKVVPREVVEELGDDFGLRPIGTGPFQYFIWKQRVKLVLHKNPTYFLRDEEGVQLPYLDAVSITFLKDANAAFLGMLKGNYDFISGLDGAYKDEMLDVDGSLKENLKADFELVKSPFLYTEYIGILQNGSSKFWNDKRARLALNQAIDKEKLIRYVRNDIGEPANDGFIPNALLKDRITKGIYAFDKEAALNTLKVLKAEYGEIPVLSIAATTAVADMLEFIQKSWEEVGVETKVEFMPSSVHRDKVASAEFDFFRKSWIADYPDAQNFLSMFYSVNIPPNGPNYTRFSSSEFDEFYEQALTEKLACDRMNLYVKADSIINTSVPTIPLYYGEIVQLKRKNIIGLNTNSMNILDLRYTKVQH